MELSILKMPTLISRTLMVSSRTADELLTRNDWPSIIEVIKEQALYSPSMEVK